MDKSVTPVNVSPFIKGARWSLLVAGIIYGSMRHKMLYRREQRIRAELERTRPEREAKQKAQKEKEMKEAMEELEKLLK